MKSKKILKWAIALIVLALLVLFVGRGVAKRKADAVALAALVEAKKAGAVLAYGNFISIVINFIILAFVIFQMVKMVNKLRNATPAAPPPTPDDIVLLREIRDSLKKK